MSCDADHKPEVLSYNEYARQIAASGTPGYFAFMPIILFYGIHYFYSLSLAFFSHINVEIPSVGWSFPLAPLHHFAESISIPRLIYI